MLEKVYLIRHGETEWSKSGRHTGLTDISLTENGRREAERLGESLRGVVFDHIFSSPLKRVRETLDLCGLGGEGVVFDKALVEWNYGEYEGLTTQEIQKKSPGCIAATGALKQNLQPSV